MKLNQVEVEEVLELCEQYMHDERRLHAMGFHTAAHAVASVRRALLIALSDYCKGCTRHVDDCNSDACDYAIVEADREEKKIEEEEEEKPAPSFRSLPSGHRPPF